MYILLEDRKIRDDNSEGGAPLFQKKNKVMGGGQTTLFQRHED